MHCDTIMADIKTEIFPKVSAIHINAVIDVPQLVRATLSDVSMGCRTQSEKPQKIPVLHNGSWLFIQAIHKKMSSFFAVLRTTESVCCQIIDG